MKRILTIAAILFLLGAFAIPVMARGPGGSWGHGGQMMGPRGGGPGYCWQDDQAYGNLTEEQRTHMDKAYKKFYDDTAQARNEIWTKSRELNTVLNSANPDAGKAKALQKEISDLRANLDDARLNLELEERKIAPEGSPGVGRGYGPGHSRHMGGPPMGPDWSRGGRGPGYCWN